MNKIDAILIRVLFLLLLMWAVWFTKRLGIRPEEIGQAVKNFNASFGPGMPARKSLPVDESAGNKVKK